MSDPVKVETLAPGVALVRIDRPEARNALDGPTREALAAAYDRLGAEDAVRCIVTTGSGKAFVGGADIKAMAEQTPLDVMRSRGPKLWRAIADCPKPVIAAVNGHALGGGMEYAMHADVIIAAASAKFGQPEIKLGIMPGAGGTQRLVRAVGRLRAMRLLLTGEIIEAAEAERIGLVSEVAPDGELMARATALGLAIAALPPLAAREIKEAVRHGEDIGLDAALALERKSFALLFATADQKEGMRAFIEKRAPKFEGG
jgi:enoyl-CoA hydratase/carnithine racemase